MKAQLKVLESLLWVIDLQTQKAKITRNIILSCSKVLYDKKLYHILEIQENALKRLKKRYNKHAYNLELFKINT